MNNKEYLERDILNSEEDIKALSKTLPVSVDERHTFTQLVKQHTDEELLQEYTDMLNLSQKVTMLEISKRTGIGAEAIQKRLNQPQYRHILFSKLQQILDVGRLMWLHNIMMEGIENPSNVGLARVLSPLLGFTTDKTMSLNLQAQIDAQRDNLPETPEDKQRYIAEILIDTGFTPQEYEDLYNERLFNR